MSKVRSVNMSEGRSVCMSECKRRSMSVSVSEVGNTNILNGDTNLNG